MTDMRYFTLTLLTLCCVWDAHAQTLTLDSCRAMALRNNRQLAVGKVQQDIADNIRKSARTKYLPKVSAIGGYELMSKQLSLLSAAGCLGQHRLYDSIGTVRFAL